MKKFSISFFIMLLLFSFPAFAQDFWELVPTPDTANPWSLCFNTNGDIWVGSNGVYLSQDQGQSWEYKGRHGKTILSIAIDSEENIYASTPTLVYKSRDYGNSWQSLPTILDAVSLLYCDNGLVFAGMPFYIFKSQDYGESWDTSFIFPGGWEYAYEFIYKPPSTIFVGTIAFMGNGGGVYRSTDNGENWEHLGLLNHYVQGIGLSPSGDVYAAVYGHHYTGIGGCYRYNESTASWIELTQKDFNYSDIVINSENILFLGISNALGGPGGVYCSNDGGVSWQWNNTGLSENSAIHVWLSPDEYVYALTYSSHKLHRSINPTVSTKEEKINDFCVDFYPNPFVNDIYINFPCKMLSTNNELFIYDIKGELIKKINILNNQYSQIVKLNTANWPIGIYFYRIHSNDNVQSGKIIKTN